MELFTHLWAGLQNLIGIRPVLVVVAGVIVGILGGAMPGVSPSMAVAILLPFTFGMSPTMGMVMLCAIYLASNYGGSITAVMINTPGTPSAVVTAFDGYPLAKNGRPGYGLGVSLVASVWGQGRIRGAQQVDAGQRPPKATAWKRGRIARNAAAATTDMTHTTAYFATSTTHPVLPYIATSSTRTANTCKM